jgi:hypothetical protein
VFRGPSQTLVGGQVYLLSCFQPAKCTLSRRQFCSRVSDTAVPSAGVACTTAVAQHCKRCTGTDRVGWAMAALLQFVLLAQRVSDAVASTTHLQLICACICVCCCCWLACVQTAFSFLGRMRAPGGMADLKDVMGRWQPWIPPKQVRRAGGGGGVSAGAICSKG